MELQEFYEIQKDTKTFKLKKKTSHWCEYGWLLMCWKSLEIPVAILKTCYLTSESFDFMKKVVILWINVAVSRHKIVVLWNWIITKEKHTVLQKSQFYINYETSKIKKSLFC